MTDILTATAAVIFRVECSGRVTNSQPVLVSENTFTACFLIGKCNL